MDRKQGWTNETGPVTLFHMANHALRPDEHSYPVKFNLAATDYDKLHAAARRLGYTYAGEPSPGRLARDLVLGTLRLDAGKLFAVRRPDGAPYRRRAVGRMA